MQRGRHACAGHPPAYALAAQWHAEWDQNPWKRAIAEKRNLRSKAGYDVVDIGSDHSRSDRRPFLAMERKAIARAKYAKVKVFWPES